MSTDRYGKSSVQVIAGMVFLIIAAVLILVSGASRKLRAQVLAEVQARDGSLISYTVAVDGDYAVVGAKWHDGYRGAAYVLRRDGDSWKLQQRLTPADLGKFDHFGGSVSISGDRIVVGATWHDLFRGAAYVYSLVDGQWIESQKLMASDAAPDGQFGTQVRVDGEIITVFSAAGSSPGAGSDASYSFENTGARWDQRSRLPVEESELPPTLADGSTDGVELTGEESAITEIISAEHGEAPIVNSSAAAASIISVVATDELEQRVEINWEDDTDRDDIIYRVLRGGTLISIVSSDDDSYIDVTGTLGVTYDYCIVIGYMTEEPDSDPVCDEGSRIITPPASVVASDGEHIDKVSISWIDMSSINEGYNIYRDTLPIGSAGPNATYFNDTTCDTILLHSYDVEAFVSGGYESAKVNDTGWRGIILPPSNVTASDGLYLGHVLLEWIDAADDEVGYRIYRNDILIDSTDADIELYEDYTAAFGDTFDYCVATKGSGGIESIHVCDAGSNGLNAPGNVNASDETFDDRVQITWDDLSDYEDGYEVTRVEYEEHPVPPDSYAKPEPSPIVSSAAAEVLLGTTSADVTSFDDLTADPGVVYTYSVRAITGEGGISPSESDNGSRSFVLAPYDVQASDGEYENRTEISWESSSTTAAVFIISRDGTFIKSIDSSSRQYDDTGGVAGQEYEYSVVALTALEVESSAGSDTGRRELASPTPVSASDDEYEHKTVISWTDNSGVESGYRVYRRAEGETDSLLIKTTDPNVVSYQDQTGTSGVVYRYSVAAYDDKGEVAGESAAAPDDGSRLLLAPTGVEASDGEYEYKVEITWSDNSNYEDGYYIYRNSELLGSTDPNYTTYEDSSPLFGQITNYELRAFDGYGESEPASDNGSATIQPPGSFNASDLYGDRVELTWIDESNVETAYEIFRDNVPVDTTAADVTSFTDIPPVPGVSYNYSIRSWKDPLVLKGSHQLYSSAWDVAVSIDHAYIASADSGLLIIDISDPAEPECVGWYAIPGFVPYSYAQARCVAVSGSYAYIGADYNGLHIIDISDPTDPTLVGNCAIPISQSVALLNGYAYVTCDSDLYIIDIRYPDNPVVEGICADAGGSDVAVTNGIAFIAGGLSGLLVIDISEPAAPSIITSSPVANAAYGISISGSYAYVTSGTLSPGTGNLYVFDISIPESPSLVGSCNTPGSGFGVAFYDGFVYVADGGSGLQVIDIGDPGSPSIIAHKDASGWTGGLDVMNGHAYLLDGDLKVLESDPIGRSSVSVDDDGIIFVPEQYEIETWELYQKYLANDGAQDDHFGCSVALGEDYAIVGAYDDDDNFDMSGSAYIFQRNDDNSWSQKSKLHPDDAGLAMEFGYNVSCEENFAIIGTIWAECAYIFKRDAGGTWTQEAKLEPDDPGSNSMIYESVDISGNRAIVGAKNDDDNFSNSGSAYIFERDIDGNWIQKPKLHADDPAQNDYFGRGVSISGNRAIVGAYSNDDDFTDSGSAYIFERDVDGNWTQTAKLVADDPAEYDYFGEHVSISGNRVIVSARTTDDNFDNSGSAYIFELDDYGVWEQKTKLFASEPAADDWFGSSVAIEGDRVIVGAPQQDYKGDRSGSAYVFERGADGTWAQTQLLASDGAALDKFGESVAISKYGLIVGAKWDDDMGNSSGSAYMADLVAGAYNVTATDGTLKSRVRITWDDRSFNEEGFRVYRDGEPIANLAPNIEVYEDFDAEPGRTFEYSIATLNADLVEETARVSDFGWRPPNGSVTGRISTRGGAAAEGIAVEIGPSQDGDEGGSDFDADEGSIVKALLFDGTGGYVSVPDVDSTFNFSASSSFTIEAWVKYSGDGGSGAGDGTMIARQSPGSSSAGFPFSLSNMRSTSEPGRLVFTMSDGASSVSVSTPSGTDLNDDEWHHVACIHDAAEDLIKIHVDGLEQGSASSAGLDDVTNPDSLSLGVGASAGTSFGGQLDEIRIWNAAKSGVEILAAMNDQLTGNEEGLVAYWPLDEGGEGVITDLAAGAHYGTFEGGVYWTGNSAPIDIYPVTDPEGNYVLQGVRYGSGATFKIRPFEGERQFEPAYTSITLTTEAPVENQVDFVDISSFTVSGIIRYANTDCPAVNIPIVVGDDEQSSGVTDKNGRFAVAVDLGEHTIKPVLAGHSFDPSSWSIDVKHDTFLVDPAGVTFIDNTVQTLLVRVGGGCDHSIGDVITTIRSENYCLSLPDTTDTTYSVSLPPQNYLVTATVLESTIPDGLDKADVVAFFQNLGERSVELGNAPDTIDYIYRAPLEMIITGLEYFEEDCPGVLTFEDRDLPDGLPVIPQGTLFPLTIQVKENYGVGECWLESGTVTIYDEVFDQEDVPVVLEIQGGEALYQSFASTPSLSIGRVDADGNDRSFQKSIRVVVEVEGRAPVTMTRWVLVTGHVAPEGADFVTLTTEPMPFYILRDPPGDNSYAFLDKGYSCTSTIDFDMSSWTTHSGGLIHNMRNGINITFSIEWGFAVKVGTEHTLAIQKEINDRNTWLMAVDESKSTKVTTVVDEQFATSSGDLFTGGGGDVYIGAGLNYVFSEVGVIEVEDCKVIRPPNSVGFEPEGFATTFAYSHQYIEDVLIPELESKIDDLSGQDEELTVEEIEKRIDNWRYMLAMNDTLKWASTLKENFSFSSGADYNYSCESGTTDVYKQTTTFFRDEETASGMFFNIFGMTEDSFLEVDINRSHEVLALTDSTESRTQTVGYLLSDDDIGDHFTVDIKSDGRYPSPVFDVRGGVSSCPYEPWPDSADSVKMVPRDQPVIFIAPESRTDVPPGEQAIFTLNLGNESPTGESRIYALRLLTNSNRDGAIVKVGGETIMNGLHQYFIDTGEMQYATLTVERGPTAYEYNDLAVMLYPPCEYALWEQGGPLQRAATETFSVTFVDEGPEVFGTPEPADGQLSFGEDISITFSEDIDCEAIEAGDITLTYLDGPDVGTTVTIKTVCDGRTIIISPDASVSPDNLEGRHLRASAGGISDRAGNAMSSAVTWDFYYRKNLFTWSQLSIEGEVTYLGDGSIEAELVNGSPGPVEFSIAGIADSIVAEPSTGTIQAGGTQSISLLPDPDLDIGQYNFSLDAEAVGSEQALAVLEVSLTVSCDEPVWVFDPGVYENSMTIVTDLFIEGSPSGDPTDMVAAFVGSELRGLATLQQVEVGSTPYPYLAFLTVYSNRLDGETVRFRVWDASECRLYNATEESYPFDADDIIGSPDDPVSLTAIEVINDESLMIEVSQGWNWISTNMVSSDMDVSHILADLNLESGDLIKSQSEFSQFVEYTYPDSPFVEYPYPDSVPTWTPPFELDNVSGYLVNLARAGTIMHAGTLKPFDTPVPVSRFWNWICYLPAGAVTVDAALADLGTQGLLLDNDMIKSQDAFAQYDLASTSWYGSLVMMEPGRGYKLYLDNASVTSFTYPEYVGSPMLATSLPGADTETESSGSVSTDAGSVGSGIQDGTVTAGNVPTWFVNAHAYQYNMTVTAALRIDDHDAIDGSDMIGAFVGSECRGVAQPIYVGGVSRYEAFIMIHSNEVTGETISFKAFDADAGTVLDIEETLACQADGAFGSVHEPVVLNALSGGGTPEVPRAFALYQNVPNPFNPVTRIRFDLPRATHVKLCIYNVKGELIATIADENMTEGQKEVNWAGTNDNGNSVTSGVYFYRIVADDFVQTKKMVLLR